MAEFWFSVIAIVASFVAVGFAYNSSRASFRLEWTKEVILWSQNAVRVLALMEHDISTANGVATTKCPDEEIVIKRLAELSSIIDAGRFFFENNRKTSFGKDKQRAYQGYRPKPLDCLVEAYDSYSMFLADSKHPDKDKISDSKRCFISLIQKVINTKWFAKKATYDTKTTEVRY